MFRVLLINLKEASRSLGFDSYRLADGLLFNALLILKIRSKIETASSLTTKSTIFSLQRAYFPCQSGINWDILILFRSSQVTCGKTCPFYYESRFLFVYESRYKNSVSLSRSVVEDLRFNCIGWQNFFKTSVCQLGKRNLIGSYFPNFQREPSTTRGGSRKFRKREPSPPP